MELAVLHRELFFCNNCILQDSMQQQGGNSQVCFVKYAVCHCLSEHLHTLTSEILVDQ